MIKSFRHNGLRRLYESDDSRRLPNESVPRIKRILAALDTAETISELGLFPGWGLHRLKGDLKSYWSISISGNWRIIFRFKDGEVTDVDYIDYH